MPLSLRALNRALLARQGLLKRRRVSAVSVLTHLVGMQAQVPVSPYVGLWTRIERFKPAELSDLMLTRRATRLALQRSTLHLVTREDCLALRPILDPVQDRNLFRASPWGRRLEGLDLDALKAEGRRLVEERPRTLAELATALGARWPGHDPQAMAQGIRNLLPVVQVPPRGVWGRSGQPTWTTADHWFGEPLGAATEPDELVVRYLAAFGPATPQDAQTWSGLQRLTPVFERLAGRLEVMEDETGRTLYDVPGAPRPSPRTAAPIRLLAEYDNVALSHADRARILSDEAYRRVVTPNSVGAAALLVDGFVAGTWRLDREKKTARLRVAPLERLPPATEAAVRAEAEALASFLAADADVCTVDVDYSVYG